MAKRHERRFYYLADKRELRGEVNREATLSERERAFRFSEIVEGSTPAPSDALLEALATAMTADGADVDSHIPAGFTYLAQFVDHDLTRDVTDKPFGTPVTTPDQLAQARSPALDLDSVYGAGPGAPDDSIFYAADGVRLKLGRTQESSNNPPVAAIALDGFDLPRKGSATADPLEARRAHIPDPRNDENLVVGQTHLAFMRFHNKMCDRFAVRGTPSAMLFEMTREAVVKHYQWMLRSDFLPRIVDPAIVHDVFTNGRKVFEVGATGTPTMPIEFSVAAYRLGHSMIRDKYNWNAVFSLGGTIGDFGTLDNLFRFSGTSGNLNPGTNVDNPLEGPSERLPTNWIADWTRLYDFVADGTPELAPERGQLNFTRPIDIRLTNPLKDLPLGSFDARGTTVPQLQRNLAFRNLVRGRMVGLATGQEVAAHIAALVPGVNVLTSEQILGDDLGGLSQELHDELTSGTPLWFYILREAGLNGGRLGAVGGRIVAETFHRAMEGSRISILRDPYFRPTCGPSPDVFRMTDLLKSAYDAPGGEIRPLSPDAPRPPRPASTPTTPPHTIPPTAPPVTPPGT
jgi:Animal haem peroxidase